MQRQKSQRHVQAANARWRAQLAQDERDAGIPDREPITDVREPTTLDLRSHGGRFWRIEPRLGYIACRGIDGETSTVVHCASIKELLHKIADETPSTMGRRNLC